MPETDNPESKVKVTVAVIKGGPEFQTWFKRLQDQTRLPAALLLDQALVEFAKAKRFDEPPPR